MRGMAITQRPTADEHQIALLRCKCRVVPIDDVEGALGEQDIAGMKVGFGIPGFSSIGLRGLCLDVAPEIFVLHPVAGLDLLFRCLDDVLELR